MGEARKLNIVEVPSIAEPITKSPGFAKKLLADRKLDVMALCGFGCSYCSSNAGNYLRINRERFADLTQEQLGERLLPATSPELAMVWPDVIERLEAQLLTKPRSWGSGEVLVFSQLTDAFSGPPLKDGTTERALRLILERTSFRVRVLTKNSIVGLSVRWPGMFQGHSDRFVVGLSTGTLDDAWAKRVEIGTPPPSARLRAISALQDARVATFGMLCPIFPDMLDGNGLEALVDQIRPDRCEHVWAEPYNDRLNWRAVRAGYEEGSPGWNWMTDVYERGNKLLWSMYATELYERLREKAVREGWLRKLRYLLYEDGIYTADAHVFGGFDGVLLQSKPNAGGYSQNAAIARLQARGPQWVLNDKGQVVRELPAVHEHLGAVRAEIAAGRFRGRIEPAGGRVRPREKTTSAA